MLTPLYSVDNVNPAFQLRWSLALFEKATLPAHTEWWAPLKAAVEADGIRLLEVKSTPPNNVLFLVSSQPKVSPACIVKSVKGRLQYLLRPSTPDAFRRNFALTSMGDASRQAVENYVSTQLDHHPVADPRIEEKLGRYQLVFPAVDLGQPLLSSHGRYVCNLQLVLVNLQRDLNVQESALMITQDMFLRSASQKKHRLSRLALLGDHLHATIGFGYSESPQSIALGYMNNLAFAHGMKHIFQPSYYVGTFGEYDMQAVR